MHRSRFYLVLFALLASASCSAAGFNCEKAKSNVEKMICDDEELSHLDKALLSTYQAVLAVAADQGALKTGQKRWLAKVRDRCKDAMCLSQAYDERIYALERIWNDQFVSAGIAMSRANANRANVFEGEWRDCQLFKGAEICSSYKFVQQKKRVCGEWEEWATYDIYSGQLQATLRANSEAKLDLICGRPGGEIRTDCDNDAKPDGSWQKAKGGLSICDDRLFPTEEDAPCSTLLRTTGVSFSYRPLTRKERKRLLDQPWVKRCLSDGNNGG